MLRKLFDDQRGAISILAALIIVGVIGFSALALEYGNGLLQQVEDQRIADLAAYSGALVYNSTSSATSASSAVSNMASLNAVSTSNTSASASVVSSPTGDGNSAVKVTVSSSVPLLLAKVLTTNTSIPVSAVASAEINANAPGCIIALSGSGNGISLSGTGSITADNCQVESNSSICADAGANPSDVITTKYLSYDSGANPTTSHCTISPPSGTPSVHVSRASASDPLAGNSEVSGATSRISTVAAISSPSVTSPSGGSAVTFSGSKVNTPPLPTGCTDVYASSAHTVTCTGTGPFNFGSVTGGTTATINNSSSGATYNFSGLIDTNTSNTVTFHGGSNATYNMGGGIYAHGSGAMSFDAGTFNIGTVSTTSDCNSQSNYSVCLKGSGSLTFGGPSTFTLAGGIYQNASGKPSSLPVALSLGYGSGISTNSFSIGKGGDGYSLNNANGATLFGDASGTGDLFRMAGSLNTTGGTCVAVSAAAEHDINGSISGAGGIVLGSGIYTLNGYVALGNSGGGDVSDCPAVGTTTGLTGLGVTLVVSGASTVTCGSTTSAFCLGAGFSTVKLTAPSSGSTASLAVIGPQSSSNSGAATFVNGASNTQVSGAFYFPNGQIYMSGAATLHDTVDASSCLELIGTQVTSTAGSALGSTCTGLGSGSTGTTIGLVQ
jgi:Flp pilus assembly protein TadG